MKHYAILSVLTPLRVALICWLVHTALVAVVVGDIVAHRGSPEIGQMWGFLVLIDLPSSYLSMALLDQFTDPAIATIASVFFIIGGAQYLIVGWIVSKLIHLYVPAQRTGQRIS